jgi:hypothetical protein
MGEMRTISLVLLVSAVSASASAATPRFALERINFIGNASPAERKLLDDRVWDTVEFLLSERGFELVHREDLVVELAEHPELKGCTEPRCRMRLGDLSHAERVLSVRITRSGPAKKGDWSVKIEQFAVAAARVLPSSEVPCNSCTADELIGDLSHALDPLLKAPTPTAVCRLTVATEPPGATVRVDGMPLGETPFMHTVEAGRHAIEVERAGGPPASSSVDCAAGGKELVSLDLKPAVPAQVMAAQPAPRRSWALKGVGAGLLALGAAGVIAGAVDLSLDGKGNCDKAAGQKQCPQLYDTRTAGLALTVVGALAVAGGVTVLVLDALRKPSRLGATLRLGPSGVFAGLEVNL